MTYCRICKKHATVQQIFIVPIDDVVLYNLIPDEHNSFSTSIKNYETGSILYYIKTCDEHVILSWPVGVKLYYEKRIKHIRSNL